MTITFYCIGMVAFLIFFAWAEMGWPRETRTWAMVVQAAMFWPFTLAAITLMYWSRIPYPKDEEVSEEA